ncbi:hypothetical protein B0H63DRAFT_411354 [Podospora didyma]|uniref:Methyltransferase n=1 Tax=Podospora didyma TaxID=330526 RepID=A0AAE0P1C0_9PEZI|nr:hypothetical protein B0H63DRAFT_411354 [Podospora didyma]
MVTMSSGAPHSQPRGVDQRNNHDQLPKRHNVATTLNYWKDPGDGAEPSPIVVGGGDAANRAPTVAYDVIVRDITGDEDKYTLDTHGFQFLHHPFNARNIESFSKPKLVKNAYYPDIQHLLMRLTGASRVFVFDHKARRGASHWQALGVTNLANRGPVTRVHVDQSYAGAEMMLRWYLPSEADELLKKRFQIINVWRPITPILKSPLAVADASSIPQSDLVAARSVYQNHEGESWTLRPSPKHRWYFKYKLTPDEVLLIKCFDSDTSVGMTRRTPHSAFEDPAEADKEERQSVEARCFVFH